MKSCSTPIAEQLAALAALEAGWLDGEGEWIAPQLLWLAESCASVLPYAPYMYPTPAGGVQLEFGYEDGDQYDAVIEIEQGSPNTIWLRVYNADGENIFDRGYAPWLFDAFCIDVDRFLPQIRARGAV